MESARQYASTLRWAPRRWVIFTAPTTWARFYFDAGLLGREARWWLSNDRPEYARRELYGVERFGFARFARGPDIRFVDIPPHVELLGWALALYALARAFVRASA